MNVKKKTNVKNVLKKLYKLLDKKQKRNFIIIIIIIGSGNKAAKYALPRKLGALPNGGAAPPGPV